MKVKILRQQGPAGKPYWQTFDYDGDKNASVAAVLDSINYRDDVIDSDGNPADRISWECSCLQGITIEPLRKFPVISDLVVDRGIIQDNLKKIDAFIGEYHKETEKDHELEYQIGRCLKCGLCLEVCPNYVKGENFYGPLFANDSYFIVSRSKGDRKQIRKDYDEHFAKGCSKSLACQKVCPMNIPTLASIAKMNRGK